MPKIPLPQKPFKTFEEQELLLRGRGLIIDCDANVSLKQINYYRLTSYLIPFKIANDKYKPGTKLSKILRIYEMDSKFRRILMSLLEHVEISLRTYIAYTLGGLYEGMGYTCPINFENLDRHEKFLTKILPKVLDLSYNKLFIQHYKKKYGERYPIWVVSEILTFDQIFMIYKNMHKEDQDLLCKNFLGISRGSLYHWMQELKTLRNECAHYHRLYNVPRKSLYVHPYVKTRYEVKSPWLSIFLACKYVVHGDQHWTFFITEFEQFLNEYSDVINRNNLGLPKNYSLIMSSPLSIDEVTPLLNLDLLK